MKLDFIPYSEFEFGIFSDFLVDVVVVVVVRVIICEAEAFSEVVVLVPYRLKYQLVVPPPLI